MKGQCARFNRFAQSHQSHQSHQFNIDQPGLNLLRSGTIAVLTHCTIALTLALPIALPILTPSAAHAQYPPGRRGPGGSRDLCLPTTPVPNPVTPTSTSALGILALVREADMAQGAKTTSANPIVWVYVPYSSQDQHRQVWLSLDEQGANGKFSPLVQKHTLTLPNTPGIMPIALPADVTLDVNKTYRWSLHTKCAGDKPSRPPIQFSITRVPESAKGLKSVEQRDRLAKDGIWLDALMIGMQNQRPGNLSADFKGFLERHLLGKDLAQEADRFLPIQEKDNLPTDQWAIAYLQKVTAQPLVR